MNNGDVRSDKEHLKETRSWDHNVHTHSKLVSKWIGSRYDEGQQQHGGGLFKTSGRVVIRPWTQEKKMHKSSSDQ